MALTATRQVIEGWLAKGYDLATDILPALTERTKRRRADSIRTWDYFTPAIAQRHALRMARAVQVKSAGEMRRSPAAGSPEILARTAAWINTGSYIPPSAVSTSMRAALLAAGLVTEVALRARQIY